MRKCKNDCHNEAAPGRKICYKCRSKEIRLKFRPQMVFYWLKQSAKKRGIEFTITKDQLIKFILENGYIQNSGRLKDHFTIDRINGSLGYSLDNIQILTRSENSAKYHSPEEHPF